jgi:hypothetical protein
LEENNEIGIVTQDRIGHVHFDAGRDIKPGIMWGARVTYNTGRKGHGQSRPDSG